MGTPRNKRRDTWGEVPVHSHFQTGMSGPVLTNLSQDFLSESCSDESHGRNWQKTASKGGPLTLLKRDVKRGSVVIDVYVPGGAIHRYASGAIQPNVVVTNSLPPQISEDQMLLWGTLGWSKFKLKSPGNRVGLTQFIGELNQLPTNPFSKAGMLGWQSRLKYFMSLGSKYLNLVFGWLPFVKSVHAFLKTMDTLDKRYRRLKRGMDKPVRTGGLVTTSNTGSHVFAANGIGGVNTGQVYTRPAMTTQYYLLTPGQQSMMTFTETVTRVWFSGKFRWASGAIPIVRTHRFAYRLFDLDISPKLMWELMPWSWLIDWFTNVGQVLGNVSDQLAGLVAEYAYVMASKTVTTTYFTTTTYKGTRGTRYNCTMQTRDVIKMRRRASPYGFGFTEGDLNPLQLSILVALGLSRSF